MTRKLLLLATIVASMCSATQAWAPLGHRLVGELAEPQLTPAARAAVDELLAGESEPTLGGVAYWADAMRAADPERFKLTSSWHYVKLQPGTCQLDAAKDCVDGQCLIGQIEAQQRILADHSRRHDERRDALKFLVHLIGDVHQPFHASDRDDLGGNKIDLSLRTDIEPEAYARDKYRNGLMETNVHSVWDYYILASAKLEAADYAARLRAFGTPALPAQMSSPRAWAAESCRMIEQRQLYPNAESIDNTYLDAQRPTAEQRIRQGAYRLAFVLNHVLAE